MDTKAVLAAPRKSLTPDSLGEGLIRGFMWENLVR